MNKQEYELWMEYVMDSPGTVYVDNNYKGLRYIISKANHNFVSYVYLPKSHPLYGSDYETVSEIIPVHGGFTYAGNGHPFLDESDTGFWVLGWDYGHSGDAFISPYLPVFEGEKVWTIKEIEQEAKAVIDQLADIKESL